MAPRPTPSPGSLSQALRAHASLLFSLLALMWASEILDTLSLNYLDRFGIQPRSVHGLIGIPLAPFLHFGFRHLLANTVPFIILGGLLLLGGRTLFWNVTVFVILVGGFGVWLLAPHSSNHLGASGLIFGYLGFLLSRGFLERSVPWMLVSLACLAFYGGILIGVLPLRAGVSWQSHLFGFLAGLLAARILYPPPGIRSRAD